MEKFIIFENRPLFQALQKKPARPLNWLIFKLLKEFIVKYIEDKPLLRLFLWGPFFDGLFLRIVIILIGNHSQLTKFKELTFPVPLRSWFNDVISIFLDFPHYPSSYRYSRNFWSSEKRLRKGRIGTRAAWASWECSIH